MKVYTYFSPVPQIEQGPQFELLELWRKSWGANGWEPVILGPEDAQKSEQYGPIVSNVQNFPTSNPREYELSCFVRWAAMEAIRGGVMTDYDVMNYGFKPEGIELSFPLKSKENHVPCVVYGNRQAFRIICGMFANYVPSWHETQVSDMTILERSAEMGIYDDVRGVKQYGEPGWETSTLVHYSSHSVRAVDGKGKADKIQKLRPV
jgi:hypothetical protein